MKKMAKDIDEDICSLIEKSGYKIIDKNSNWSDGKNQSENYNRIYKNGKTIITLNIFVI